MSLESRRNPRRDVWRLAEGQHGVISRRQLLAAELSPDTVDSRIASGRLHRIWRGVYAIGRPQLSPPGWWMGAVLACGPDAVLSHASAAALWGILAIKRGLGAEGRRPAVIHVSVRRSATRIRAGIKVHRSTRLAPADRTLRDAIPVTTPSRTLIDLGTLLTPARLERAVNEADRLGLIDPDLLRSAVGEHRGCDGVAVLRTVLDRRTFQLTDSELERRFMRLVKRAGLPVPLTQQEVNGFRVDFFWPEIGLVVETDGLRYHRTASQQARDRVRDQTHVAAGLTPVRFTHAQVRFTADRVVDILQAVTEQRFVGLPGRRPGKSTNLG